MRRSAAFLCPITLTPAEPVEPDSTTAQRLREVYGPKLSYLEQGWLLYLAEGGVPPLAEFAAAGDQPSGSPYLFAGPVDQVVLRAEYTCTSAELLAQESLGSRVEQATARVRLVADGRWDTLGILGRLLTVQGRPAAVRYVSLVADRFDERGWRVERVAAVRCKPDPFELAGAPARRGMAVELTPFEGLFWWGSVSRR